MEFLNRTAMAFIEMGEEEDIYRFIARQIHELVPDSMIGVSSFDPGTGVLMLRAVEGKEEEVAWMREELGDHIRALSGMTFPVDTMPEAIPILRETYPPGRPPVIRCVLPYHSRRHM